jgi:ATP-dependent Clp protease protease subunit
MTIDLENVGLLEAQRIFAETELFEAQKNVESLKAALVQRELDQMNAKPEDSRIFTIYGPITYDTVAHCMYEMDAWSRRFPGEEMTLIINTPGGSMVDGFALYDFLEELKTRGHHLTIKAVGMAASMGGILLQVADRRVLGAHSFLMIHELQAGLAEVRLSEFEDTTKLFKRFQDKALDILSSRSTLSRTQIKNRWKRKDFWLDAEEAVRHGFADEIL